MRALMAAALALVIVPGVAHAQVMGAEAQPGGVQANVVVNGPQAGVAAPAVVSAGVSITPLADGRPAPVTVSGPVQAACPLTPCQMPLVPGTYTFNVQGPGGFTRGFNLPGVPSVIGYRQRHTGRLVGGIIELAIGGPFAVAGASLAIYSSLLFGIGESLGGVIVLSAGIVLLAVGIPLVIVGALNVARSGPILDVRPGGMMGARGRSRDRGIALRPTFGYRPDTYAGGAFGMMGLSF